MRFCDVLEIKNGRNQKQVENPDGIYPIYGSGGIMGWADSYICDAHTVIIGRKGTINNPIYVDRPFWNVDTAFGLVANRDMLLPKYLFYFCCNFDFEKLNTTVTIPSLTKSNLLNIEISVPPIAIQQEIINRLDKIENLIELRRNQLEQLNQLVKSRFIELFGDPTTNPNSYPIKAMPEIAEYWNGLTYKPEDVSDEGTVVLRSSNIQNMQLDFSDIVKVQCKIGDKKYVQNNDILMCSRNGSAKLVGKVALIHGLTEPMSFGAFMMIIRSKYYPYLMTYFQLPAFRSQITTGATTTINQITGNMMNKVMLPVPDKETVNQFAAFVEQTDKLKFIVQNNITAYTALIFYFANIYWKRWASVSNTGVSL